jgi:hypothetical protein
MFLEAEVPFDNTSMWIGQSFRKLMQDLIARRRPAYVWGVLQGCALGKVLGSGMSPCQCLSLEWPVVLAWWRWNGSPKLRRA